MIRRLLTKLLTPVARRLSGVHPNTLTMMSLITGVLSGLAFFLTFKDPAFFLAGGLLAALSGLSDSLDGIVARMHCRCSRFGDFLDHFCDRIVDLAILVGLSFSTHVDSTLGLVVVILILLNNYLATQIHASFQERFYGGIGKAELFPGLVIVSVVFAFFPDISFIIAGRLVPLMNLMFVLVGVVSTANMIHSLHHVYRICAESA